MNDERPATGRGWIAEVLDQYEGPLTRYAARLTLNVESARDVVQETFLRLCGEDPTKVNGNLPQWLFTVCRNRALDVRRKEGRMEAVTTGQAEVRAASEADPAAVAEHREGAAGAMRVLSTLPEKQQEVIRLRFQNGLSYKQIAAITTLSVSNVGFLIHTAIRTLREQLASRRL